MKLSEKCVSVELDNSFLLSISSSYLRNYLIGLSVKNSCLENSKSLQFTVDLVCESKLTKTKLAVPLKKYIWKWILIDLEITAILIMNVNVKCLFILVLKWNVVFLYFKCSTHYKSTNVKIQLWNIISKTLECWNTWSRKISYMYKNLDSSYFWKILEGLFFQLVSPVQSMVSCWVFFGANIANNISDLKTIN